MYLSEYVTREGRGALSRIQRETGLAYTTVFRAARGRAIKKYEVARRISAATGGAVSVEELCAPKQEART